MTERTAPLSETTALIDTRTSLTMSRAYDLYSRVSTITYPDNYAVINTYDPNGYLMSVTDAVNGYTYWNAPSYSAEGQYTAFNLGNGLTTVKQYDPATGLLQGVSTGAGACSAVQYLTYTVRHPRQSLDARRRQSGRPHRELPL